jgi:alpha-ketoglutarate-dependent taurine dioxygenase
VGEYNKDNNMKVRRISFGYEISDIDYNSPHHANFIKEKVVDGRFVVIKNTSPVHPEHLVSLYRNIGMIAKQPEQVKSAVEGYREICRVHSKGMFHGKADGSLGWHNAMMMRPDGDQLVAMYMNKNNCVGGDTGFTDAQGAYQDLTDDQKKFWLNQTARYFINNIHKNQTDEDWEHSYLKDVFKNRKEAEHFVDADGSDYKHFREVEYQPIVTKHPVNNKLGFYFPYAVVKSIVNQSNDVMMKLRQYILSDKYVYYHKWDLYDLMLSDQVHSLHARTSYNGERELWRSGIRYK